MGKLFQKLTRKEQKIFSSLHDPQRIQDFLDKTAINFEKGGDTLMSPRRVIREKKAHCFEGALFAAACILFHGKKGLLLDLKTTDDDDSHVVALFRQGGKWGAISKTNHAVLRYRDPVYRDPRELAMSFFHEYFRNDGKKTLRSWAIFDVGKVKKDWVTSERDLWSIDKAIEKTPHKKIIFSTQAKKLRPASKIEIKAGKHVEWKK